MTTFRWYLLGLLGLFAAYVAFEYYKPKPLDWTPTLSNKDKIPYGTYALYDLLPDLLGTDSVASVRVPIFNQLLGADEPEAAASRPTNVRFDNDSADAANDEAATRLEAAALPLTTAQASYVFINNDFTSSGLETKALLRFIGQGNSVFIAASEFNSLFKAGRPSLADSLGFSTVDVDTLAPILRARVAPPRAGRRRPAGAAVPPAATDSVVLHLAGSPTPFRLPAPAASHRLVLYNNRPHRGATLAADAQGRPVLLRLDVGRGHLYLCSIPLALSNYWLLRPRQGSFALAALGRLPAGHPVWWDEYQKQGRVGEQSLLRVVMASPALRAAYYLLLLGGLLFVLVEARRRQRIIPVLTPLPNTSLLFTRTVAGLYRQGRSHQQIAEKKIQLFLDYLRIRFHEAAPDLADEAFRERLSEKAGLPRARVDELVRYINFARTAPVVTDRELLILSAAMRSFRQESQ